MNEFGYGYMQEINHSNQTKYVRNNKVRKSNVTLFSLFARKLTFLHTFA